tara:strand:+ start:313 stop:501 length:189 start_codon:yes stop_codon:yes gene_type:complete
MTKKDRTAISISIILFLLTTVWGASAGGVGPLVVFFSPVILYWAYRFTKDDISFIKSKDKRA